MQRGQEEAEQTEHAGSPLWLPSLDHALLSTVIIPKPSIFYENQRPWVFE